ncbi:PREDICTED: ewing's tumor-associated antigen 1 isoform X2 [Cyprinodon variegatus]|uniref:ETAA1 activator of ATR kinase n=2 Tax=Cyprinodon variegatus TaxID=28743 RepID=A0A3Q2FHI1_CYPVA|nr:PREDICTED: ewing's tumor-associated antigen 1 isoform X2 [Cyprinodon variegatus]XP_015254231.1 PREDICTED: ewing's tumor-associated antigen 1 isoform X2 [Cyprinodon variegatus]
MAVEISDIVNRIAPKNIKPKSTESSLLHWIDDGVIPCTPYNPKPTARRRSCRQSCVKDLMKLAKELDKNMQQDEKTSVQQNAVISQPVNATEINVQDPKCPSSLEQAEAELNALFDSSTQGISGRLSQGSVSTQDRKDQPKTPVYADHKQLEPKTADKLPENNLVYFEDDWDNDDLINDPLILALTQDPNGPIDAHPETSVKCPIQTNTKTLASVFKTTTSRRSFKLEPNPHFQTRLDKDAEESSFTVIQPKSKSPAQTSATRKTITNPQPNKVTEKVKFFLPGPPGNDASDSFWDDGDDDALLYQLCDSVERVSNNQLQEVSHRNCEEKPKWPTARHQNITDLQVNTEPPGSSGMNAKRQSSGSFVRCNSLPVTTHEMGNYQGWNIPLRGGGQKAGVSQSFPGGNVGLGKFNHGAIQADADMKPHTVTTRVPQNSRSQHAAFKRNVSDSAIISNKVFVTNQTTGKCSAAEIERKRQEALARRRLRMQTPQIHNS